jgi:methyl-accepting chemotaxis protein
MAATSEVVMFGLSIPSFLAGGIQGLGLFFALAVGYLTARTISLTRQSRQLRATLDDILSGQAVSPATIDELDNAFAESPVYDERWRQFRRSISVAEPETGGTILVSPIPVRQIFSSQEILASWINMRFIDTVPALISSVGLLLTFLAILFGLNGAIVSSNSSSTAESLLEFEKMRVGIVHLVSNLSGKFLASVFALGSSALFVLYERIVVAINLSAIVSVRRVLDEAIEFQSPDRILREIHGAVLESVNRSRIVSAHIPQYIRQEVHHAAGSTLERMEGLLHQLCTYASGAKKRGGASETLTAGGASLEQLEELQHRLLGGVTDQMGAIGQNLEVVAETLGQMAATVVRSSEQMSLASREVSESIKELRTQSEGERHALVSSVQQIGGTVQEVVGSGLRSITERLEETAGSVAAAVSEATATISRILQEPRSVQGAKAVDLNAGISQTAEQVGKVAELISESTSGLAEVSLSLIDGIKALEASSAAAVQAATATTLLVESNGQKTAQLVDGIVGATRDQLSQIASSYLAEFKGALEQSTQTLASASESLTEHLLRSDERRGSDEANQSLLGDPKEFVEQIRSAIDHLGGRFEDVQVAAIRALTTSVEESSAQVQESLSQVALSLSVAVRREQVDGADMLARMDAGFVSLEKMGDALDAGLGVFDQSARTLSSVVESAQKLFSSGDEIVARSQRALEEHTSAAARHRAVFEETERAIKTFVEKLDDQVWRYNAEALEAVRQQVFSGAVDQLSGVQRAIEETGRAIDQLPRLLGDTAEQIISASDAFDRMIGRQTETAVSQLERTISGVTAAEAALKESAAEAGKLMTSSVETVIHYFEGIVSQAVATLGAFAEREKSDAHLSGGMREALDRSVERLVPALSNLSESLAAGEWLKDALEKSAHSVAEGASNLTSLISVTKELQARDETLATQSRYLLERQTDALSRHQEVFSTLDQSIAKIMSQLEEQMWRFQSQVQEQLQGSLHHYDELTARGLVTFESAITNLADVLIDHRNGSESTKTSPRVKDID